MKKIPVHLSDNVATLLRRAVKSSGSYNPDDCMFIIEEDLTIKQETQALAFLTWVHENKKKFGHNIRDVYAEFTLEGVSVYNRFLDKENQNSERNIDPSKITVVMRETPPPKANQQ